MNGITFDQAIARLPEAGQASAVALNDRAVAAGYAHFCSKSGKRQESYKVEYKKTRSGDALFVLRVEGEKWYLRVKLYHLGEYEHLLEALSEPLLSNLLTSRACRGEGCTAFVAFKNRDRQYELCRHGMRIYEFPPTDVPGVWALIEAESRLQ